MNKNCRLLIFVLLIALQFFSSIASAAEPLRVVYSHKVCYEPFIIAREQGYFAEEGLNIVPKLVTGGIMAAESLMTGAADVAAMGDAPFLIAASRSKNISLLARYGGGAKMHRVISSTKLTDIRDLEGARVGIQMGSSTYGAFLAWAKQQGLNPNKIQFIPLSPLDMPQAMQSQQIDAMAGSEPWPSNVETACAEKVHELTDFSALGNTFPLVAAAKKSIVNDRQDEIKALLRALQKAIVFMDNNRAEAVAIAAAAIGLPQQQQHKCTYQLNWGIGYREQDRDSMEMTAQYLLNLGKIDSVPTLSAFIENNPVE